jgi:DeoR family fructose operon transcriptional repressor
VSASSSGKINASVRRLPAGRKTDLAAYIREVGQVTVAELADRFGVSLDTIRRDLDQLDADGIIIRTHGGALSPSGAPRTDTALDIRRRVQTEAKEQIGALAATLVTDGSTLLINAGTTTLAVARHLRDRRNLIVATNNLQLPAEIPATVFREMYVFGGTVRLSAMATIGPVTFRNMLNGADIDVRCDLALIAVGAVSADAGYSTSNIAEAAMMREMMDRAARVAILADSSKFGRQLFAQVAQLRRANYFVTDASPPPELAEALRHHDVKVLTPTHVPTVAD